MRNGSTPASRSGLFTTLQPPGPRVKHAHIVDFVVFSPLEGLPYVVCICGARMEAAVDPRFKDPYTPLMTAFALHRNAAGLLTTSGHLRGMVDGPLTREAATA